MLILATLCFVCGRDARAIPAISPGFTISGPGSMATISNAQVGSIQITVTPRNGFTGGVHLECGPDKSQSNYQNAPYCAFSLLLNSVTVTSTTAQSASLYFAPLGFSLPTEVGSGQAGEFVGAGCWIAAIVLIPLCMRCRRLFSLLFVVLAAGTCFLSGCGGSPQRTPSGVYQYVITGYDTATNSIHESATVSVQVTN